MSYLKFDYHCPKCNNIYDVTVDKSIMDTPKETELTKCPECHEETKRLIPAPLWKWTNGSRGF